MSAPRTRLSAVISQSKDRQFTEIQRSANETKFYMNQVPDAHSVKSAPTTFTAGQSITFSHKLKRVPTEIRVVWVTGGYGVWLVTAADASTITIQMQNACTATFRIS